jgi:hypothetical protein
MERPCIVILEERVVMSKSSMVASTIPKNPIYHGKRDASLGWDIVERNELN